MVAAAEAVLAAADELNRLDAQAGDGDLGVTMATAARTVMDLLPSLDGQPPAAVLRACGAGIAQRAPSTSGTLLATALLRAARALGTGAQLEPAGALANALEAACAGIAERGKAEPGSKTMLDALVPAAQAAAAAAGGSLESALAAATAAAEAGARATVSMRPRHGRAGWLAERSAGHEDAGARLVAIILGAAAGHRNRAETAR